MKKKILFLILTLFIFSSVRASEIATSGDNVTVEGDYSQLKIVAGEKVNNKSTNDGLSIMAATNLVLEGESTYGFYAGKDVTVKEYINKDLFIAGGNITFETSTVRRDLYVAASNVKLKANIGRNVYATGSTIDFSGAYIEGNVYVDASRIIFDKDTEIKGVLDYSSKATVEGLDKAHIADHKTHVEKEENKKVSLSDKVTSGIISLIGEFILLVVILLMLPDFKEELDTEDLAISNILKNVGVGVSLLILVPILCILGMISVILLPLSLIIFICYFIVIYLAYLFVCYVYGNLITTKVFEKDNMYLKAFVGLLIGKIITFIPVFGGLIVFIMILFGIGHYIKLFKKAN